MPTLDEQVARALGRISGSSASLAALARGDQGAALTALEQGFARRDPFLLASSLTAPWWAELRGQPRFTALAARLRIELPTR